MSKDIKKIADFFYETGSLRMIARSHRHSMGVDDVSDNIASHSHRVSVIGFILAELEGADPYKVSMMCIFHDLPEARSGDQNWIHKQYVSVDEDRIIEDQTKDVSTGLKELMTEYSKRESIESKIAKDADMLDQLLLLKEYEWRGQKEATLWINGKNENSTGHKDVNKFFTESAKNLVGEILDKDPGEWWKDIYTSKSK